MSLDFYAGKRVCVTGATGLIGSYAVKLLVEAGATVRAIAGSKPVGYLKAPNVRIYYACDLMVPYEARIAVDDNEVVINCAGITGGVNLPKLDPVGYVGPATSMVINVLHACIAAGVRRFGFLSSTTVYSPRDRECVEPDLGEEPYPLYRGICYSKRFLEQLCRYYHETTGIGMGIVRPSGAYGRFDNFNEDSSHVIPGMINRALTSDPSTPFQIWGDGKDVRDFIHAEDVARGLLLAVAHEPTATPINIASGQGTTTAALARKVLNAAGQRDREIEFNPSKPSALRKRLVDITRARELLRFEPRISLADGLRDTIEWRKQQI